MLVRVHECGRKRNRRSQRHSEVPDTHYASRPLGPLLWTRRRPVRSGGWTMAEEAERCIAVRTSPRLAHCRAITPTRMSRMLR